MDPETWPVSNGIIQNTADGSGMYIVTGLTNSRAGFPSTESLSHMYIGREGDSNNNNRPEEQEGHG